MRKVLTSTFDGSSGWSTMETSCSFLINQSNEQKFVAVRRQKRSILELETVLIEAANLTVSRPIGTHPTHPDDSLKKAARLVFFLSSDEICHEERDRVVPRSIQVWKELAKNKKNWCFKKLMLVEKTLL